MKQKLKRKCSQCRIFFLTLLCGLFLMACKSKTSNNVDKKLVADADLIFSGSIAVMNSALSDDVDAGKSMVVTVDNVFSTAEGIALSRGEQLTLIPIKISDYKKGDSRLFYARVNAMGENITATETGSTLMTKADTIPVSAIKRAQDEIFADKLNERITKADLVLSGNIKNLTVIEKQNQSFSEHDPEWIVVEVETTESLKGTADKTVRFLYPGSNDVAYRNYPKISRGEEWLYILNRSQLKEAPFEVSSYEAIVPALRYREIKSLLKK